MNQAAVESDKSRQKTRSDRSWWRRCVAGLLVMLGGLGTVALVIMIFGRCSGEEFSPHDFTRRSFHYFRIPLVKLQVTPVYRSKRSNPLVSHLQSKKFLAATSRDWQLVSLHTGVAYLYEADPLILCRYLDQRDAKHDLTWLKWSSDHADLADVFWPVIARVARAGLYVITPDLFKTAREATQPEELRAALHQRLVADALELAQGQYQLAEYDAAIRSCTFVLDTVHRAAETAAKDANLEARQTEDMANVNGGLTDIAIKSLRLRGQAYAKGKQLKRAQADLERIAELEAKRNTLLRQSL